MKQIIPFVKDLSFNTRLSEVTSIALEHNLSLVNNDSIVGNFIISGKYKINDISVNEELFEKSLPFDITLDDKYDASKVQLDIDDFYYEIINEEYLRVHIDVLADNLIYYKEKEKEPMPTEIIENISIIDEELKEENTRNDNQNIVSEESSLSIDEKIDVKENIRDREEIIINKSEENKIVEQTSEIASTLQNGFLSEKECYSTYKIHIIRENETLDEVKEMYNISKEELEKYNSLDKIVLGTKLIIPVLDE